MKKPSIQIQLSLLMALAILLISAAGYLSYRSLSSIAASIKINTRPDMRILAIRDISTDLQKAENSVRLFILTRRLKDIQPYYATLSDIDEKVNRLKKSNEDQPMLLMQIDTISSMIEQNITVWNEMLRLQKNDSVDKNMQTLIGKIQTDSVAEKPQNILRRVFGKKPRTIVPEEILSDLNKMEKQDSIINRQMRESESQLAMTSSQIRSRFYGLISAMESEVAVDIENNRRTAARLAAKTYLWLALFTFCGTLLVILALITVVRFLRKNREYQQALEDSREETIKLARTRELFVANMSHEIRTPVTAIYGFTEQLLHNTNNEKNRKILEIIRTSSDHLIKIINDILDMTKLQNGMIQLEKNPFSVSVIFDEVHQLLEKQALNNNTKMNYHISANMPPVLLGDSYRLKQIMINIVGNAIKFTNDGNISYTADCVIKSEGMVDLRIVVSDTGIGIEEDKQATVFDDFTQAETSTARKYGGTGLGLPIVKKLVTLQGGTIMLQSSHNKGTTIEILLPYTRGKNEKILGLPRALVIPDCIKNLNILVADDEEYNRKLFKTIFDRWGNKYQEAVSGTEALEFIKNNPYDVVLMDMRMPRIDGLKATARIRNDLKKSLIELPVILVSAIHSEDDLKQYRQIGVNAFLPKPFTEKVLLETLLSVLELCTEENSYNDDPDNPESETVKQEINLSHLYNLANNDIDFIKQMLFRFIESTDAGLTEMNEAILAGDPVVAADTAHRISAPCKHVGANVLFEFIRTIEKQARSSNNTSSLKRISENARSEFESIRILLNAHIEKIQ